VLEAAIGRHPLCAGRPQTALICFIHARELLDTNLGLAVLLFLSAYWLVRALLQVQYFGFKRANTLNVQLSSSGVSNQTISYILFVLFLLGSGLYLAPVVLTRFNHLDRFPNLEEDDNVLPSSSFAGISPPHPAFPPSM
jgi:hypothetical protein